MAGCYIQKYIIGNKGLHSVSLKNTTIKPAQVKFAHLYISFFLLLLFLLIWMRPKKGSCFKPNRKIYTISHKIYLTSCSAPTYSLFCSYSHGPSVTSGGDFYPALPSANVAGKLQTKNPVLPSTPLTLVEESLGVCQQHTVKYCMDIGNCEMFTQHCLVRRRIMRSESSLTTFDIAMPDL